VGKDEKCMGRTERFMGRVEKCIVRRSKNCEDKIENYVCISFFRL